MSNSQNTTAITVQESPNAARIAPIAIKHKNKNTYSRLSTFAEWLDTQARAWHQPDLAAYRDHLLARGLKPTSVSAHLSSIRGRYRALLRDNAIRQDFLAMAGAQLGPDHDTPANRKALLDEYLERLRNTVDPANAPVKVTTKQDRTDRDHVRLTPDQARALIAAPGIDTLKGLRDTAIMALMLGTGLREAEIAALEVPDLRQRLDGNLALEVRHGKGDKARLVPYGDYEWVLSYVDAWLNATGISGGPVFRGWKAAIGQDNPLANLQDRPISTRAIQKLLAEYPIMIDGELRTVRPHDLRRTYARINYDNGMAPIAIQQNLGHASLQTTLGYIGTLDANARKPRSAFQPPHKLADLQRPKQVPLPEAD